MASLAFGFLCSLLVISFSEGLPKGVAQLPGLKYSAENSLNFLLLASIECQEYNSSEAIVGASLAWREAQSNLKLAKDFTINLYFLETKCDPVYTSRKLFQIARLGSGFPIVAIIGPSKSNVFKGIATFVVSTDLNMIAYSVESDTADIDLAGNRIFRTSMPHHFTNPVLYDFFTAYGWIAGAVIAAPDREPFFDSASQLSYFAWKLDIAIEFFSFTSGRFQEPTVSEIVDKLGKGGLDYRIFILWLYPDDATNILCELYRKGLYGKDYFYFVDEFPINQDWELYLTKDRDCELDNIREVLKYSVSIQQAGVHNEPRNSAKQAGNPPIYNANNCSDSYSPFESYLNLDPCYRHDLIGFSYDATWTLLTAVDKFSSDVGLENERSLHHYDQENHYYQTALEDTLRKVRFQGMSGNISFDEEGDRHGAAISISQYLPGPLENVRYINYGWAIRGDSWTLFNRSLIWDFVRFNGGYAPVSATEAIYVSSLNQVPYFVIVTTLCFIGIVICSVCLVLYAIWRHKPAIKIFSPKLLIVSAIGGILAYLSTIISTCIKLFYGGDVAIDGGVSWACLFSSLSSKEFYLLCISPLVFKMFRTYRVFDNPFVRNIPGKTGYSDRRLLVYILIVNVVYSALNVTIHLVEPFKYDCQKVYKINENTDSTSRDGTSFLRCVSQSNGDIVLDLAYFLIIYSAAFYFAWKTRKIAIHVLNDSKSVALCFVVTSMLQLIQILLRSFDNQIDRISMYFFTQLLYTSTILVVQGVLLFPGLWRYHMDPNWKPTEGPGIDVITKKKIKESMPDINNFTCISQIFQLYMKSCDLIAENQALRAQMEQLQPPDTQPIGCIQLMDTHSPRESEVN